MKTTSQDSPIRVDWVSLPTVKGKLGLTLCPGKKDEKWDRDLETDIKGLMDQGMDILVSLLPEEEYKELGLNYVDTFRLLYDNKKSMARGCRWPDGKVPDEKQFKMFDSVAKMICIDTKEGRNVVVHCRGGVERSGTIAAYVLYLMGYPMWKAMAKVRAARVSEWTISPLQEAWLENLTSYDLNDLNDITTANWIDKELTERVHTGESISISNFLADLLLQVQDKKIELSLLLPTLASMLETWVELGMITIVENQMIVPSENFMSV